MECLIQKWLVWIVVVWLMLLGLGGSYDGCLEQEKAALLQLKPFFYNVDGVNKWGEAVEGNCCEWERVECNPTTRRVIHLFLNQSTFYTDITDIIYRDSEPEYSDTDVYLYQIIQRDDWYLNASLFLPFQELKSLYLSGNSIAGCLPYHGFERLSLVLDKLEILDLNYNRLHESILPSLSQLSSLKSLYLGSQFAREQHGFPQPTITINGIKVLSKLDKLAILDLHGNTLLGNNILSQFEGFRSLKTLHLQKCGLIGTVDMLEFSHLKNLKELYLAYNSLESLGSFHGLINLEVLDVSGNLFNDSILPFLSRLSNLKTLSFGCNLNGSIDFRELESLSKLEELHIFCNFQYFFPPQEIKACTLPLQSALDMLPVSLRSLRLNGFSFNQTMTIQNNARELGLINLEVLDLSDNFFNGSVLPYLGRLSNLKSLSLRDLKGSLDFRELESLSNLEELHIFCDFEYYFLGITACTIPLQSLDMLPVSLRSIRLNGFSFNQTMTIQNNERELGLINLEVLDLRHNRFNGSVLPYLGRLSNLKSLSLGENLKGSLDFGELDALTLSNLEHLYIACDHYYYYYFSGPKACSLSLQSLGLFASLKTFVSFGVNFDRAMTIHELQKLTSLEELHLEFSSLPSNFFQVVGTMPSLKRWKMNLCEVNGNDLLINGPLHLKNLEHLSIQNTSLEGNFLQTIGAMPSLTALLLEDCGLTGTFVTQGLCEFTHLQELHVSGNNLTGDLPECLSNLTSLEILDLSRNHFSGNISALQSLTSLQSLYLSSNKFSGDITALESLTSLQYLRLSNNYFQIPISLGPLFNLSKLKSFYADNNAFFAETKMPSLPPRFQLVDISLSCCGDGGLSFPRFLYHQNDLQSVDLSNIYFKGDHFPNWLLENNTRLNELYLDNSSLSGTLQLPYASHLVLSSLVISNNFFSGNIPTEIGALLPSLHYLNMSKNCFNGSIPSSFGYMRSLYTLDLSNNRLSGAIPEHLFLGCSSLGQLVLSNNTLQGRIFSASSSLTNLIRLQLDRNNFSGTIPDFLSNSLGLSTLDVSHNKLSGRIPRWMGDMFYLEEVIMANNHLEGEIPVELCELHLVILDLSSNNINGSLPSCLSPSRITRIHLSKNRLSGALDALHNSSTLVTLDISDNHFTGSIPSWIGGLSSLRYLLLNNNHLEGRIPIELCNLNHLSVINLSHNKLSGRIPRCLKITPLKDAESEHKVGVTSPTANKAPPGPLSFDEQVEITTKSISYYYRGEILPYMSGMDLSCNNLVGEIPYEIGNFHKMLLLNLSHNSLTGHFPPTFANLRQIESLDLSHNNLSGHIPPQLVGLFFLAYFSVAYNNFSGKTPQRIAQFGTFDESSYRGNPLLCGEPLRRCFEPPSPFTPKVPTGDGEDNGPIDMNFFYVSFGSSYIVVLLAIASVLYINPYWRRAWFYCAETASTTCYYFVIDNLIPKRWRWA